MEKGLVDLNELRKQIPNTKYSGKSSYCFRMGNKIIKVYVGKVNRDKIVDFSKYSADTIVFPDEYKYENGQKAGEVSIFIPDEKVDIAINEKTKIKLLMYHYDQVMSDFMTYPNICMYDLRYVNVLYSEKRGFHIIDTTDWEIKDDSLKSNIFYFNICVVDTILNVVDVPTERYYTYLFLEKIFYNNCLKYGIVGKKFIEVLEGNLNGQYRFHDLMSMYQQLYKMDHNEELETIGDMKEFTKILKKG